MSGCSSSPKALDDYEREGRPEGRPKRREGRPYYAPPYPRNANTLFSYFSMPVGHPPHSPPTIFRSSSRNTRDARDKGRPFFQMSALPVSKGGSKGMPWEPKTGSSSFWK